MISRGALAAAVATLVADPVARARMGAAAAARIRRGFSPDEGARRLAAVFWDAVA